MAEVFPHRLHRNNSCYLHSAAALFACPYKLGLQEAPGGMSELTGPFALRCVELWDRLPQQSPQLSAWVGSATADSSPNYTNEVCKAPERSGDETRHLRWIFNWPGRLRATGGSQRSCSDLSTEALARHSWKDVG